MVVFIKLSGPRDECVMSFPAISRPQGAREIKLAFTQSKDHAARRPLK
jgi:hypothetical protein